jgi:hypothetical protein
MLSGCVIHTGEAARDQPRRPPAAPHKAARKPAAKTPAAKTPTAQPTANTPQPGVPKMKFRTPKKTGNGTLVVEVSGGSCVVTIDGQSRGDKSIVKVAAKSGRHTVTCQPAGLSTQTQETDVQPNAIATVKFDVAASTPVGKAQKPLKTAPPVGRPKLK